MSWVTVGVAAVSTAVSIFGNNKKAKAQARAARRQARQRELQAQRLLKQNAINRFQTGVQGEEAKAAQLTGFAKSGVDIGSGSALQVLADTQSQVLANQYLSAEEAQFNAQQLRNEGQALKTSASNARKAATFDNISSIVTGAGKIAKETM